MAEVSNKSSLEERHAACVAALAAIEPRWRELEHMFGPDSDFPVEIDREKEVITICGVPYAFDLFKALGRYGWPDGTKLEIVNRDPAGAVTLRRLEAEELPLTPEDERLMSHG